MGNLPDMDLQELLANPREALDIEIKGWLDLADPNQRAGLAKAIIALANSGGGYVIIGLREDDAGEFAPAPNRPATLSALSQDAIQDAVQRYLDPTIQCRVEHVEHPRGYGRFPVIEVPGHHRMPIKSKAGSPDGKLVSNRVYIRRAGPRSEEPQTSAEWDALFDRAVRARKDELLDEMRDVLSGAVHVPNAQSNVSNHLQSFIEAARSRWNFRVQSLPADAPPRFPYGHYEVAFVVDGEFDVAPISQFRETFRRALKSHTGWPPFVFMDRDIYRPVQIDGALEAWIGPDSDGSFDSPAHHDFWRADPRGYFYLRRGYNEDAGYKGIAPGTTFDITTPSWRIGEILLQAFYVAAAMGAQRANLLTRLTWTGLAGRHLVSVGNPQRRFWDDRYVAHQAEYSTEKTIKVDTIYNGLPEIVSDILGPLYSLFDFWVLPKSLVEEELREMRRHIFY